MKERSDYLATITLKTKDHHGNGFIVVATLTTSNAYMGLLLDT